MTRRIWKTLALQLAVTLSGVLGGVCAHAEIILEQNVLVTTPAVPAVTSLGLAAAGQWMVSVTDLSWPQALQSLSFALTDNAGVLVSRSGAGSIWYDIVSPTALFAVVYATPNTSTSVGLYHISIAFTPAVSAVPLPAAAWLLLSGLCGIAAFRRKHATVTNSVVQ